MKSDRSNTISLLESFVKKYGSEVPKSTHSISETKADKLEPSVAEIKPTFFQPLKNSQTIALDAKSREIRGLRREISVAIKNQGGTGDFRTKWEAYCDKESIESFSCASFYNQPDVIQKAIYEHNQLAKDIRTLLLGRLIKKYAKEDTDLVFDTELEWSNIRKNGI